MRHVTKILIAAGLILSLCTIGCNKSTRPETVPDNISSAVILAWKGLIFEKIGGSGNKHSVVKSRIYAIVHDAVNATQPRFETYAFKGKHLEANPEGAAATAAHHVLKSSFPARTTSIDAVLNSYLPEVSQNKAKQRELPLE